ncbi:succinate dehydrogenase assembly factor 2, mitochondrial [Aristolochia californica]|uniref:succinate dehydrogenase assembly factor 2, mitochondrial n=1 Tax=Aristolochia californica TaxID=171875 RepID=UPI0035DE2EF3
MANLRRALVQLNKTLISPFAANRPSLSIVRRLPETQLGFQLGTMSCFSDGSGTGIDFSNEESKRRLFNRLLYRSRQRGFLELDLVLGNWVETHIRTMDEAGIKALVEVLDLENPDLWKWLTGQEQPPEAVINNPVFSAVRSKVLFNLDSHAAPETRAKPGHPWVRGWDDKRGTANSKFGNQ